MYNVVEVNGADFAGDLNVAIVLDDNTIGRYLDPATEAVNFTYTAGVGDDIFNIADLSTGGAVSSDEDFAMDVQMSAGDDILIINVPTVDAVSVDGGEGENTIKVAQSHGTTTANTFAEFANFQTYEVEGSGNNVVNNTIHKFDSMSGIENVIIATDGNTAVAGLPTVGDNTQLVNLEADQNVTVSGKNQTIGNNSTADQLFGIVTLTNDTGEDRTVALENTARLSNTVEGIRTDGVLTVAQLLINEDVLPLFPGSSDTTGLTVDSAGARNVANAVAAFNGQDVETLDLVGTQDLTFNVAEIANQAAATGVTASTALDIDASELTGDLNLAVTGAMIGNWGTATGLTDIIVGTDGDNDTLMLWGAQGNDPVTVTGFETIQFGSADFTMFGDLDITPLLASAIDATGIYDAQNTVATSFVIADDIVGNTALTLNNLGTGVTVDMGDANRDATGAVVDSQVFDDAITLNSGAVAGTPADAVTVNYVSNIVGGSAHTLIVGTVGAGAGDDTDGYQTINIDVAHAGNLTAATGDSTGVDARTLNLTLTEDSRVLDLSGGADNSGFRDTMAFGVQLPNALNRVDISDYEGDVTFTMQQGDFITAGTALAQTDVRFVMSEDDANITLSNMDGTLAAGTGVEHNSVFEFTGAKTNLDVSEWFIDNVVGAGQLGASIDNITRFDVSDLGITSFDQISIDTLDYNGVAVAGSLFIRSEAEDDASILTAVNQNTWEIEVVDLLGTMVAGELTEDNFIFA